MEQIIKMDCKECSNFKPKIKKKYIPKPAKLTYVQTKEINNLIKVICAIFQIEENELFSSKRLDKLIIPRFAFYYIAYKKINLMQIASVAGKKDHTTIIHGIRKCKDLQEYDIEFKSKIYSCLTILGEKWNF